MEVLLYSLMMLKCFKDILQFILFKHLAKYFKGVKTGLLFLYNQKASDQTLHSAGLNLFGKAFKTKILSF